MKNWIRIVENQHALDHSDNGHRLVLQPPASLDHLLAFRKLFGPAASMELQNFYEQIDGFGIEGTNHKTSWFLVPIEKLPELDKAGKDWFQETHPDLAKRFFPFIDWDCGDYSGYLLSEEGKRLNGIFTFEHEEYEFDKGQDDSEFLYSVFDSLEELLSPG